MPWPASITSPRAPDGELDRQQQRGAEGSDDCDRLVARDGEVLAEDVGVAGSATTCSRVFRPDEVPTEDGPVESGAVDGGAVRAEHAGERAAGVTSQRVHLAAGRRRPDPDQAVIARCREHRAVSAEVAVAHTGRLRALQRSPVAARYVDQHQRVRVLALRAVDDQAAPVGTERSAAPFERVGAFAGSYVDQRCFTVHRHGDLTTGPVETDRIAVPIAGVGNFDRSDRRPGVIDLPDRHLRVSTVGRVRWPGHEQVSIRTEREIRDRISSPGIAGPFVQRCRIDDDDVERRRLVRVCAGVERREGAAVGHPCERSECVDAVVVTDPFAAHDVVERGAAEGLVGGERGAVRAQFRGRAFGMRRCGSP